MKRVVVLKIDDYNQSVLKEKIQEVFLKHFSVDRKFDPSDKILLKPNLLMEAAPEEAITTHPAIVGAVGAFFKGRGNPVFVADSPGGFASYKSMDQLYEKTGIKTAADSEGIDLLYPTQSTVLENIPLCWWAVDATKSDRNGFQMINIAKLKTHNVMVLTLATKNLYGCISGLHKSHLHKEYPKTKDFTNVMFKLYNLIKPKLNIVDGILAMEGNGPAKLGKPKKLGLFIIGDDALYTDYAISKVLGIRDESNPLIKEAKRRGLLDDRELEIISECENKNFSGLELPPPLIVNNIPSLLLKILIPLIGFGPVIDSGKCRLCGKCIEVCPQNAIHSNKKLRINRKRCIMCMCCAEMCPFGAVAMRQNILIKLIKSILNVFNKNKKLKVILY